MDPMPSALSRFALRAMTAINTSDFIRYESCSRKVEAAIKVIEYRDVEYKTEIKTCELQILSFIDISCHDDRHT
jgi:hypothetical protein